VRVGRRLQEVRLAADQTQKEIAQAMGIEPQSYARTEAGLHNPSVVWLSQLAQIYGEDISTFFVLPKSLAQRPMGRPPKSETKKK